MTRGIPSEDQLRSQASRRRFLLGAAATGVTVPVLGACSRDRGRKDEAAAPPPTGPVVSPEPVNVVELTDDPFTLGVASGDPDQESVVIWTRLAPDPVAEDGQGGMPDGPVDVVWEVAADDSFTRLRAAGLATTQPDDAHAVHVLVDGLEPGERISYRFRCGDWTSPVGTTTAMPDGEPDTFRLAVANCQMYEAGHWAAYRHMAEEQPDLVVHLGDYIYEFPLQMLEGRSPLPDRVLETLADYRIRYGCYKREPELRDAHAAAPFVVTWDDHEVANNYAGDTLPLDDDTDAARTLKTNAYRAWWEHTPTRLPRPDGPDYDIYRSIDGGSLFRLHLLDQRQYADEPPCRTGDALQAMLDNGACDERFDELDKLGAEQEGWLAESLGRGGVRWNLLGNPMVLAGVDVGTDEPSFYLDTWDGYVPARQRLIELLAGSDNPVVLTGDYHAGMTLEVREQPYEDSAVVAPEFMAPPISSTLFSASATERTPQLLEQIDAHGYLTIDIAPAELRVAFRCLDDVTDRDSAVETRSTWIVADGNPNPKRV